MILENPTPVAATLISAPIDGLIDVPAFVIAKETYDVANNGALSFSAEPMPINVEPIATPFGVSHSEIFPRKDRADFVIEGTVVLPSARNQVLVTARLGDFSSRIRITGDRAWTPRGTTEPVPTGPIKFTEMPVSYAHAFGGMSQGPMGPHPWPYNPGGRGFYQSEEECIGNLLPNIEWADAPPIRSWRDRPDPAGWAPYPMFWGLRAVESVVLDENKNAIGISRKMFNHAHPAMVVPAISVGDRIEIEGMQSEPLIFEVPNLQMAVTWFCGREQGEVPLSIDGLFVWTDQRKVVITRRTRFRYPFRPNEPRRATLRARSRRDS